MRDPEGRRDRRGSCSRGRASYRSGASIMRPPACCCSPTTAISPTPCSIRDSALKRPTASRCGQALPTRRSPAEAGIELDDFRAAAAKVRVVGRAARRSVVDVTIHEGRNRQVRRMFDALGHPVLALDPYAFRAVALGESPPGCLRPLTARELTALQRHRRPPEEAPRTMRNTKTPANSRYAMNVQFRIVAPAIAALVALTRSRRRRSTPTSSLPPNSSSRVRRARPSRAAAPSWYRYK